MYFDPGMGSLVIQAIIAVLAVAGGYFVTAKTKFKKFFKKKSEEVTDQTDEEGGEYDTL